MCYPMLVIYRNRRETQEAAYKQKVCVVWMVDENRKVLVLTSSHIF